MRHRPSTAQAADGSVWVRTFPLTLLHDHTLPTHTHDWDQLTYAAAGALRVSTADASWIVPPHRAVWVPAGIAHAEQMFAPGLGAHALPRAADRQGAAARCGTLNVSSLLRELILHVSRLGALDRRDAVAGADHRPAARSADGGVRGAAAAAAAARRARAPLRVAAAGASPRLAPRSRSLARKAGASRRTIERLFLQETHDDGGGMAAAAAAASRRAAAGRPANR